MNWLNTIATDVSAALKPILEGVRFRIAVREIVGKNRARLIISVNGAESFSGERLLDIHRAANRASVWIDTVRVQSLK